MARAQCHRLHALLLDEEISLQSIGSERNSIFCIKSAIHTMYCLTIPRLKQSLPTLDNDSPVVAARNQLLKRQSFLRIGCSPRIFYTVEATPFSDEGKIGGQSLRDLRRSAFDAFARTCERLEQDKGWRHDSDELRELVIRQMTNEIADEIARFLYIGDQPAGQRQERISVRPDAPQQLLVWVTSPLLAIIRCGKRLKDVHVAVPSLNSGLLTDSRCRRPRPCFIQVTVDTLAHSVSHSDTANARCNQTESDAASPLGRFFGT